MSDENPNFRKARVYDDVADTYERVNVPRMFAVPGRVLALAVAPPAGARVLDVGAGTGAVARALREFVGPDALVVVADASA
ncbi:MAG TPA: SAM-dependent methyltransferase, partial [Candidatus Krumholzibacteria bacterium]|nr:SAM-dependent methyltransferase [Candidatus Krumholzibacteria bacterium]